MKAFLIALTLIGLTAMLSSLIGAVIGMPREDVNNYICNFGYGALMAIAAQGILNA